MIIRWRREAVRHLEIVSDYISEENPHAARAVIQRILQSVDRLEQFPNSGREGIVSGTQEVVVPGLPYIVVYVISGEAVNIIAVFHAAQSQPKP